MKTNSAQLSLWRWILPAFSLHLRSLPSRRGTSIHWLPSWESPEFSFSVRRFNESWINTSPASKSVLRYSLFTEHNRSKCQWRKKKAFFPHHLQSFSSVRIYGTLLSIDCHPWVHEAISSKYSLSLLPHDYFHHLWREGNYVDIEDVLLRGGKQKRSSQRWNLSLSSDWLCWQKKKSVNKF